MPQNVVTFPQPDVALRANLLTWAPTDPLTQDLSDSSVFTDGNLPEANTRLVKIEASAGASNEVAESSFVTVSVFSSTGAVTDARSLAYRLKDILPQLLGNGIGSITDVKGPTKAADISDRRLFVITCTVTALGAAE